MSNHSFARSARTLGANGRKSSRCLIRRLRDVARIRSPRIREQRPIAERARSNFHTALKPSDDVAVGDHVGGVAGGGLRSPRREAGRSDGGQDRPLIELRTEIGRRAARSRTRFSVGTMHGERRADRSSRIVRRTRDEELRERVRRPDQLVGHAVKRHAACDAQALDPVARARRRKRAMTAASVAACSAAATSLWR